MSYQIIDNLQGVPIKAWTKGVPVEESAKEQLRNIARMPFVFKHVAVMPDVHFGLGATVGSVIATKGAIIPAAVGVDLGCGMIASRTSLTASDLPDNLHGIRDLIERMVPHGRTDNGGANDRGAFGETLSHYIVIFQEELHLGLQEIVAKHPKLARNAARAPNQFGTLGTGNHFIELCVDEEQRVWIMLHSGSRGIGNAIGTYFIDKAKEDMHKWFIQLPHTDLAYIPKSTDLFNEYWTALRWAQRYAFASRQAMMMSVTSALYLADCGLPRFTVDDTAVNCHHNYATWENHFNENVIVTRKGAVHAGEGQLGIIPGSMGAKSFIVRGKGNHDSFCSCSHGAGRKMGRNEAKRQFTLADHIKATEGIECRKDEDVIDETPQAYKDIDAVMAAQSDLVDIVHTLKQVVCVKG